MRRLLQLALLGVFVYVAATIAAFVYLEWWQAILVSWVTFAALVYGVKVLIRNAIRRLTGGLDLGRGLGGMAAAMFQTKSRVLRNAGVDIHSVRPAEPPVTVLSYRENDSDEGPTPVEPAVNLYAFDVSIFPDRREAGPMTHWDVDDLRLVPADAVVGPELKDQEPGDEYGLDELKVVVDGVSVTPDESKLLGPQRLRFRAGVRKGVREVKFRYYFEAFGTIRLPDPLLLPAAGPGGPT